MNPEQQKFLAIMACLALQINTTDAKNTLVTGSCGANATYTIYDDYSMIISGDGKIYSLVPDDEGYYRKAVDERWSMVKTVTIQEGITGIDMGAFSECTELTDIEIPQSVKSIDGFAFSGCSKLSSFTFPSSIAVYNNVFNNCVNLTHLHIADGADFICPIYSEEDNPFAGCPIEYLYMGGNILSGPEGEPLTTYYANRYGRHAAFEYVNTLKTLEIGDQVTIIEDYCFSGCPIENLTIGKNVAKIGYAAFANAKLTSPLIIPASIGAIGSGQHFPSTLVLEDCDSPLSIFGPYFSWSSDFCNDLDSVYVGRNFLVDDSEDITMPNIRSLCINTSFEYLSHEREGDEIHYDSRHILWNNIENLYFKDNAVLGNRAFVHASITNIYDLPNVGDGAFYNCHIKNVKFSDKTTVIGRYAFYNTDITEISIPATVTTIDEAAFSDCSALSSVTIQTNTPPSVGMNVFDGVPLSSATLYVPVGAKDTYTSAKGWQSFGSIIELGPVPDYFTAINPDGTTIRYRKLSDTECEVTRLGGGAEYTGDITIPASVTYAGNSLTVIAIGNRAFEVNTRLSSIIIPNTVTSIGEHAFTECFSLSTITLPNSITTIGDGAFSDCQSLASIVLPDAITSIGRATFYECFKLTSIQLPSTLTSIGEAAFCYCTALPSITLPNTLTSIDNSAFEQCTSLTSVTTLSDTPPSVGSYAFASVPLSSATLYVPAGSSEAYQNAQEWKNFGSITSVIASGNCGAQGDNLTWTLSEDGVLTISGSGAMKNYDSHYNDLTYNPHTYYAPWDYQNMELWDNLGIWVDVKSVILPNGITHIGDCAFSGCSLTSVEIPSSVTSIGDWAFSGLTSINIPSSVEQIGNGAFDCHGLTSVKIPSSVTSIGYRAFPVSMTSIVVDANNPVYDSRNNCNGIIETATNELVIACESTIIPSTVTSIGEKAFFGCSMTSIELPSSLTCIGWRAFEGCNNLTSVEIPSSVTNIGSRAFLGSGLTSIEIPASLTSIEESTFSGCDKLASIEIPSSVTYIGYGAFMSCLALSSIKLPSSLTSIECNAFADCEALTSIEIPSSVTVIGDGAFGWCSDLISVKIPSSITTIHDYAFMGCDKLSSITITSVDNSENILSAIEEWGQVFSEEIYSSCILYVPVGTKSAFQNAPGWKNFVNIEEIVASGNCGAEGDKLTWIISKDGVLTISGSGKMTDSSPWINYRDIIKSVIISEGATSIGVGAFEFCRNLTSIEIPSTVTSISEGAFAYTALTSIEIPSSVTSIAIGIAVFEGCNDLTSITIEESNPIYDSRDGCNAIIETATNQLIAGCQSSIIPSSVTRIGGAAFYECNNLTSVAIPSSVTIIDGFTFYHCFNLSSITITSVDDSENILSALEDSNPFDEETYSSCTLYVPAGTKSAFQNANGWKNFVNIIELEPDPDDSEPDTDLSLFADVVYIPSSEVRIGSQAVLSLQLDNVDPVIGFDLKLYLPEGVSVATTVDKYGDTSIGATLTDDRTSLARHTFGASLKDGVLTLLCYSDKKNTFLGNSGEVAQITIDIAEDVAAGDYPIIIRNEAISLNSSTPQIEYIKTTLTISDYKLGDANGDTFINVGDITTVAGYILGDDPDPFIYRAADANEDTFINVGDITSIAGMILEGTANNARSRDARQNAQVSIVDNSYDAVAGTEIQIPVCVNNTIDAFGSFQFDIDLPAGFEVKDVRLNDDRISRSDFFGFATVADGKVRVLDYTLSNQTVRDTKGAIAYITIASDRTLASGDYLLNLTNSCFSDAHHTVMAASATISLSVSAPLGIESLSSTDKLVDVYTIQGQLIRSSVVESESLNGLQSGVYLIDGRKIIK